MNTLVLISGAIALTILVGVTVYRIGLREAADPQQSDWSELTDHEKALVARERAERRVGLR